MGQGKTMPASEDIGRFMWNFFLPSVVSRLISASGQVIVLPVLSAVLQQIMGLYGILASGPIADGLCTPIAAILSIRE